MKIIAKIMTWGALSCLMFTACKKEPAIDKTNPFFSEFNTPFNVPPFEKIMTKHYMPAFIKGMEDGKKEIETIVRDKSQPTFTNTVEALDNAGELLSKVSEVFFGQTSANTNDSLQKIEIEISPRLSQYQDEILLNPRLFRKIKFIYENQLKYKLNPEQTFLLDNLYKAFVRNGANLNKKDQDTLKAINSRLSVLTVRFSQNVLAETNKYIMYAGKEELAGLPPYLVAAAAETAKASGQEGKYGFTTQRPSIFPFLQFSPYRTLRRRCLRPTRTEEITAMSMIIIK
jgi:peptidyl-dipeptidase Dcp